MAEIFTGMSGKYVKLEDTIAGFNMILSGELDDLPEQAFYPVSYTHLTLPTTLVV